MHELVPVADGWARSVVAHRGRGPLCPPVPPLA
jgi:hypothetical protein